MGEDLSRRLVPDPLWTVVAPLLPRFGPRPQGGGTAPVGDRDVLAAVVFVLMSGCAWRRLPSPFAVSPATAHRRFTAWTDAGLWERLHRALRHRAGHDRDWGLAVVDAALARSARTAGSTPPLTRSGARRRAGPGRTGPG